MRVLTFCGVAPWCILTVIVFIHDGIGHALDGGGDLCISGYSGDDRILIQCGDAQDNGVGLVAREGVGNKVEVCDARDGSSIKEAIGEKQSNLR